MISEKSVIALLKDRVEEAGSLRRWAEKNRLSATTVSYVLNGKKPPARKVLAAIGYERHVAYKKIEN